MPERRFAVVVLPNDPAATQIEGLRVALDDPRRHDLPAHLTLVPPISLGDDSGAAVRTAVRGAASVTEPFRLDVGPAATFAPATPTLHLSVGGERDRLDELRDALRREPLDRPDVHPFEPHVTLLQQTSDERIAAGRAVLTGRLDPWLVDRVVVMERCRPHDTAVWVPVMEEPFGGPDVVGRGGVEMHLRAVRSLEPQVAELAGLDLPEGIGVDHRRLVVIAEEPGRPGEPVAAAVGAATSTGALLESLIVAPAHRRMGVARQVLSRWCLAAARRGAPVVVAAAVDGDEVLQALGFDRSGSFLLRRLDPGGS